MDRTEIESLLKNYRVNKARYETLILTAQRMQRMIAAEQQNALAANALHAQSYSGMPHSNRVGRPVEDLVIRFMDGFVPEQLADWMAEDTAAQRELMDLATDLRLVDTWLAALNERERTVIEECMINDRPLKELSLKSHRMFDYPLSVDTIRGIKRAAMNKICDIAR